MDTQAVLTTYGFDPQPAGGAELKVCCAFHNDSSPSCFVNTESNLFKCHTAGCNAAGNLQELVAKKIGSTADRVADIFRDQYGYDPDEKITKVSVIESAHVALASQPEMLDALHARGITDELIRKYRIGFKEDRITIPIKSATGNYVNLRQYKPGAPGPQKFRNQPGRGQVRLYPIEQKQYSTVVLCGGELKAIAAAAQLNAHNIGAISTTAGEDIQDATVLQGLRGKRVYICFDIDAAGRAGAQNVARLLNTIATWVGVLDLPLDPVTYASGDVSDFIGLENGVLFPLLEHVKQWERGNEVVDAREYEAMSLREAMHADSTMKRVKVKAIVTAVDHTPYAVPSKIGVNCSQKSKLCGICKVYGLDQAVPHDVQPEDPAILSMIGTSKKTVKEAMRDAIGVPQRCTDCVLTATDWYNVEDCRITPQMDVTELDADNTLQPALCIGEGIEANTSYEFIGQMMPSPETQQACLLMSKYDATEDALSTYKSHDLDRFKIFQPVEWTVASIKEKLHDIYDELEQNCTGIFQRRLIAITTDLVYHSMLFIPFEGKSVKGWVEGLILGDSSQGKSETVLGMQKHYKLAKKVESRNATVAGLLGGLQQLNNRWFVTWGAFPSNDKMMVILEEMKGLGREILGRLTDMRSTGVAELPKIETRQTHARVRFLGISNPPYKKKMNQYGFGIEAIEELIGSPEDVRRFDIFTIAAKEDIDPKKLKEALDARKPIPEKYTSELCRDLILFAWTRKIEDVEFESQEYIRAKAVELSDVYSDEIPIVDKGSMRLKLARLAASLAARTFSVKGETVFVRNAHVDTIIELLHANYKTRSFGYADYSTALRIKNTVTSPDKVKEWVVASGCANQLVKSMLHTSEITAQDMQDWCSLDRDRAQAAIGFFVRHHCVTRVGRVYTKTNTFIELLRKLSQSNLPNISEEEQF